MPRKIRQLKRDLRRAGFIEQPRRGKGSHSYWTHPIYRDVYVNISGSDGNDAQPYQEDDVRAAIISRD